MMDDAERMAELYRVFGRKGYDVLSAMCMGGYGKDYLDDALLRCKALSWTTEKPTTPGWYWFRESPEEIAVYFVEERGGRLFVREHYSDSDRFTIDAYNGEWSGPLEPPG